MSAEVEVFETSEHGTVLRCRDTELADQFEDYLTEQCYVLFSTRFESTATSFFFGQASSVATVRELFDRFTRSRTPS